MKFLRRAFDFLYFQTWNFGLWNPPDRKFLIDELIPYFMRRDDVEAVLFVGVRRYTKNYGAEYETSKFVTVDIDPRLSTFGSESHFTLDVRDLAPLAASFPTGFSAVFLNGVVGYGLNSRDDCIKALRSIRLRVPNEGWLIVGANPQVLDNFEFDDLAELEARFERCSYLPLHKDVFNFSLPGYGGIHHQYRFFRARHVEL